MHRTLLFAALALPALAAPGDIRGLQTLQADGTYKSGVIPAPLINQALLFTGDPLAPWVVRKITLADTATGEFAGAAALVASQAVVTNASKALASVPYTGTGNVMRTRTGIVRTIYVNAGAMIPRMTAGAAPGIVETSPNRIMIDTVDFDPGTEEGAGFWLTLPQAWNLGAVSVKFQWTSNNITGNVKWDIAARCYSAGSILDQAPGTEQSAGVATLATVGAAAITAATPALTIGGTLSHAAPTYWQITRDTAGDTMAVDAKLIGVVIEYLENATEPSPQSLGVGTLPGPTDPPVIDQRPIIPPTPPPTPR